VAATSFLIAATTTAGLVGIPLGLRLVWWTLAGSMGDVSWAAWVQTHGQLQLFGWLGLAILGVTFHAMAHLFGTAEASARTAWSVLVLQLSGLALRFFAPLAARGDAALQPWSPGALLLVLSGLALLGAFGITLEAHIRTMPRRGEERRSPAVLPRYLLVGVLLWFVGLLVNLDGSIDALRFGPRAAGAIDSASDLLVITSTGYGMGLVALGMSLRVVVGWLDLPIPNLNRAKRAWIPLTLGAVLRVTSVALGEAVALEVAAASLWALGVAVYVPSLRGLWSRDAVAAGGGRRGESDPPLA
jgi:hypothetical protein